MNIGKQQNNNIQYILLNKPKLTHNPTNLKFFASNNFDNKNNLLHFLYHQGFHSKYGSNKIRLLVLP